ncbi:MAG: 16S rRNA (cytidine(1402)-2'-O)-methyltransferase, partial [Clostridia bacterium]|nr:16S rRNA (cytidine(1402)-2'-O)-methyltransferase [Clostridia bacterium]
MRKESSPVSSASNEKNRIEGGTLYLVATPIGNLSDLSDRAYKVLSEVDFIAAEDTRNTGKLLSAIGISKSMTSYYEHNKKSSGEHILKRLLEGQSCALVTDAGTPAISDPGEDIVRDCIAAGIKVTSVPGAAAVIVALTLSGMNTRRFAFEGFLPVKGRERKEMLSELSTEKRTLVLYEAPHKLKNTLDDLLEYFGSERRIALCRELTKLNEEVMRCTLA